MSKELTLFTKQFQVSETLTFELRPIGKTEENIKKSGLLDSDQKRADDYPQVKKFLDGQHKQFLQKVLSGIRDIDWNELADKISEFQGNKDLKTELEKLQADYRKKLVERFTKDEFYDILVKEATPSKLFSKLLKEEKEVNEEIKTFARFACYFKGYQENRRNIYSNEAQQTAAAFRAVNENFTKFLTAVKIFRSFENKYPDLVSDIADRTRSVLNGKNVSDLFQVNAYNQFLPQSGIDYLNAVISEINYAVNQYRQKHKEVLASDLSFIPLLFKQILSDREQAFTIDSFENDKDLCIALQNFTDNNKNMDVMGNSVSLFPSLRRMLTMINADSDLFVNAKSLSDISNKTTGGWNTLQEAMTAFAEKNFKTKKEHKKTLQKTV